jgi:hypothetical protein
VNVCSAEGERLLAVNVDNGVVVVEIVTAATPAALVAVAGLITL